MSRLIIMACTILALSAKAEQPADDPLARLIARDAEQTVVVANQKMPGAVELAKYYMQVRGIPADRLCVLDLPVNETITRYFYEQNLRDPLLAFLRAAKLAEQVKSNQDVENASGWRTVRSNVRYLVLMHGVPLRIAKQRPIMSTLLNAMGGDSLQNDGAAVDSELACVLYEHYPLNGFVSNPLYNQVHWQRNDWAGQPLLLVARLDGPGLESVRRMIDDSIAAEHSGLQGRAYIDIRSTRDAGYQLGDFWLREAGERLERVGMDVVRDYREELMPSSFPVDNAAIYLGWYAEHVSGPFLNDGFRFRPGAVAYHLHSGSAKTLRSENRHWAGPLLTAGAAAVMGAVDEPYLSYTPDLQVFVDRLVSGYSFGESAYLSQRVLSWQITVIGDPLYRPFAIPLEEGIRRLEESTTDGLVWAQFRQINLLANNHQINVAMSYARKLAAETNHLLIKEKLADLYAKNELWNEALPLYREVVEQTKSDATAMRVGHRLILVLRLLKKNEDAAGVEAKLQSAWPDSPYLDHLKGAVP